MTPTRLSVAADTTGRSGRQQSRSRNTPPDDRVSHEGDDVRSEVRPRPALGPAPARRDMSQQQVDVLPAST